MIARSSPVLRRMVARRPWTVASAVLARGQNLSTGPTTTEFKRASELSTADLIAANTHVGHAPSRWTASNTPYILGTRSGLHIIDPNQSLAHLRRAAHFVRRVSANGGIVLFVGHAPDARPLAADAAVHAGQYYVHDWVPGTLTNTDQVVVARQAPFDRDGSLPAQAPKPDVLVILDITSKPSLRAVKEARKLNIPTIAVVDTDVDARWVTYPVPANDDSAESLALVARALAQAAADGRRDAVVRAASAKEAKDLARRLAVPEEPVDSAWAGSHTV